jgi:hypothetical protein
MLSASPNSIIASLFSITNNLVIYHLCLCHHFCYRGLNSLSSRHPMLLLSPRELVILCIIRIAIFVSVVLHCLIPSPIPLHFGHFIGTRFIPHDRMRQLRTDIHIFRVFAFLVIFVLSVIFCFVFGYTYCCLQFLRCALLSLFS